MWEDLNGNGYEISQSALALRFLPINRRSRQAKLHKNPLNMKVMLPQNDEHKEHEDSRFCFQMIEHIKQRLVLCGNSQVCVESVDDKAKVSF